MGFGGFCVIFVVFVNFVCFNGSVVVFVIFYRVGVVLLWLCVFFLICFVIRACVPVASLGVFFVFVVCFPVCICVMNRGGPVVD